MPSIVDNQGLSRCAGIYIELKITNDKSQNSIKLQ